MKLPDFALWTNERIIYFHTYVYAYACAYLNQVILTHYLTKNKQMSQEAPKQFPSLMLEEYQRNNVT